MKAEESLHHPEAVQRELFLEEFLLGEMILQVVSGLELQPPALVRILVREVARDIPSYIDQ